MILHCGQRVLDLSQPVVMGILNITPDSFSDGGCFYSAGAARIDHCLRTAEHMVSDGAAILDIGGESTRPGATAVSSDEELDRVLPVLEAIATRIDTVISVDTSNPVLMVEAARRGAGMVNDVRALQREGSLAAAVDTGLPVCLMHMQGEPVSMQQDPRYGNVVAEVDDWLRSRMKACEAAGIPRSRLLLDPGFGFGKSLAHNLSLLKHLETLTNIGLPLLVGLSRKSIAGKITGREVEGRLPASLALAQAALDRGANILRVHDVAATVDMVKVWCAVRAAA